MTTAASTTGGFTPRSSYPVTATTEKAKSAEKGTKVSLAGRLMLWRPMGGLVFGHIQDGAGRLQIALRRERLGAETFAAWKKAASTGDFVGVTGEMFFTAKGEKTVDVAELEVLNKTVRKLPDKWKGVSDTQTRYRRRYLDLLVNPESKARFTTRFRIISSIRRYLDSCGFLEVETPILQDAASGAAARPFTTRHNALGEDFYLRVSPETYLKRVVAGGFDRVYELGRNFRNEGIDPSHLQEFTMLEWYAAYWDYRDNMAAIRELLVTVLDETLGTRNVSYGGITLDFDGEWPQLDYRAEVARHTGIDLTVVRDLETLRQRVRPLGLDADIEGAPSYAALADLLYKKTVRPRLVQPCFLVGHPVELVPLARRSDDDPSRLDMFQLVVNGWEIVKAYSELVDPADQRHRLEEQQELRQGGDEETMMMEEDFLECMEYGMPPMSGLGLGIDRFVALLTDAPALRDVVLFPQLRATKDGEG